MPISQTSSIPIKHRLLFPGLALLLLAAVWLSLRCGSQNHTLAEMLTAAPGTAPYRILL